MTGCWTSKRGALEAPREIIWGMRPPRKDSRKMGPVPVMEAGFPHKDTPLAALPREDSLPGAGHREDISCGRNWPREAGTQPANCSTRRGQRKKWPTASRRHQLPAGLGSQDCSLGLVPGTASREPRQLGCALPNRWPSPEEEMPEPVGTPVGWTWHSQPLYYS